MSELFADAKWIWAKEELSADKDDVVIVRREFSLEKPPKKAVARIAAENRYFLAVNGREVIADGGVLRTGNPGHSYYDETDIADYLVKGSNVISAVVIYYGANATGAVTYGHAGFLFECPDIGISSDENFTLYRDRAFSAAPSVPDSPSSGITVKYDATMEGMLTGYKKAEFRSNLFSPAGVVCEYGCEPWGELLPRPVPLYTGKCVEKAKKTEKKTGVVSGDRYADVYTVTLPTAMNVYPRLSVTATSGDRIEVRSDRYEVKGCFDDEGKTTANFRLEYVCKSEAQTFEFPQSVFGEKLIFSVPSGVKVQALGYRESLYGSKESGSLATDDGFLGLLYSKCADTLLACMRESFVDTPERGGAILPAAAAIGADCAMYLMEDGGLPLTEKIMTDMLELVENDVLYSNVYGEKKEIPSQTLIALSEFGFAARYYAYVGMNDRLKDFTLAALRYLAKWDMGEDGLVARRRGDAVECDKLYNCDKKIIINMLYHSALRNVKTLMEAAGDTSQSGFLSDRETSIREALALKYDGRGYTSQNGFYDERANAFAVLCGIAGSDKYPGITKILASVGGATPLYEAYVLEALCKIGRVDIALERMESRYHNVVENGTSTLPEDFYGGGAQAYLGSVAPLAIMYRYIAGVDFKKALSEIYVTPDLRRVHNTEFSVSLGGGKLSGRYFKDDERVDIVIDNATGREATLCLRSDLIGRDIDGGSEKTVKLGKGKSKFRL